MFLRLLSLSILFTGYTSLAFAQSSSLPLNAPTATNQFYTNGVSAGFWKEDTNFSSLLQALESLSAHGLNPSDYHLEALKNMTGPSEKRDRLATDAWLSAAAHMLYGKLNPTSVEPDWTAARHEANLSEKLREALSSKTVLSSLEQFAPKQPSYAALKTELSKLRTESEKPQALIPSGETLKTGMQNNRVALLKS